MNIISKIFRWAIYIPSFLILLTLIDIAFGWALGYLATVGTGWVLLGLMVFSGILGFFFNVSKSLISLVVFIAPNVYISGWVAVALTVLNTLFKIYGIWTPFEDGSELSVGKQIIFTLAVIELGLIITAGALTPAATIEEMKYAAQHGR